MTEQPTPTSRFIRADPDVLIHTEIFGDSDAQRAFILISGAGAPAAFWPDSFCDALASHGFKVLRYDHRDAGQSTHCDSLYTIESLIADTASVIAATPASEYHLIGHSMGGYMVAMMLAQSTEFDIKTGTVISAGPTSDRTRYPEFGMTDVSSETWAALEGAPLTGDYDFDLPTWLKTWRFMNGTRPFDFDLATRYTQALHKGDIRNRQVATNHIHAMTTLPSDLPERITNIQQKLLVLHGSDDKLVPPDNGSALARLAPNNKLHILNGAGHMFFSQSVWEEIEEVVLGAAV